MPPLPGAWCLLPSARCSALANPLHLLLQPLLSSTTHACYACASPLHWQVPSVPLLDVKYHWLRCFVFTGDRTWGVLTKLDLMDKGTNALDVSAVHGTRCVRLFVCANQGAWFG